MAAVEQRPPSLDSSSDPPSLFDGTTRLYTAYICPYAQRVWITRNYKGLQDKIKLVPINLQNRPAWYKEKVYAPNKVPSLEHDGKVIGESLDLVKYLDSHFEGPSLTPEDPAKKEFAEELLTDADKLISAVYAAFNGDHPEKEIGSFFDHIETALGKFDEGPFFLGQLSLVDIVYVPFVERFQLLLTDVWKLDPTVGRPKLAAWIEELNKIVAYKETKVDQDEFLSHVRKRYLGQQ